MYFRKLNVSKFLILECGFDFFAYFIQLQYSREIFYTVILLKTYKFDTYTRFMKK